MLDNYVLSYKNDHDIDTSAYYFFIFIFLRLNRNSNYSFPSGMAKIKETAESFSLGS